MFAMMAEVSKPGAFAPISLDLPLYLAGGERLAERLRQRGFSNLVSRSYPENREDLLNAPGGTKAMQDFAEWIDHGVLET